MPRPVLRVIAAMFDVKPVDKTGQVNVGVIEAVSERLDLSKQRASLRNAKMPFVAVKQLNEKAPTDAASNKLTNSVGAARSASPANHLNYSLSQPISKSSGYVDNQKPRFYEIFDSMEDRGFAPLDSQVVSRGRHYASPTVNQSYQEKLISQDELEKFLNAKLNVRKELGLIGAKIEIKSFDATQDKPRVKPIFALRKSRMVKDELKIKNDIYNSLFKIHNSENTDNHDSILTKINERIPLNSDHDFIGEPRKIDPLSLGMVAETVEIQAQSEVTSWIRHVNGELKIKRNELEKAANLKFIIQKVSRLFNKKYLVVIGFIALFALALNSLGQYGTGIQNEIIANGNSAAVNLEKAGDSLKRFDFQTASNDFSEAFNNFSKAGESLDLLGVGMTSLLSESLDKFDDLTAGKFGASKLKSARNLIEAGKLLSEAGKSMSDAINLLSKTNTVLNSDTPCPLDTECLTTLNFKNIFSDLKKTLRASSGNLSKASALLSDMNLDILPEDKKEIFTEFRLKLPALKSTVSDAVEYTDFLENLLGLNDVKKYLILFQNDSELRPTGGFPGSYAVVTLKNGQLGEIFVDDVYNLDGQLKENIIPPQPLQHITPTWGMRDSNWFIDFPVSAQKIMEFFKKESGYDVDGVITMSPAVLSDLLKIAGPIELPEYGLVIDSDNFLHAIQAEVEYGDNRQQPKQVIKDVAPKLLEKIFAFDSAGWFEVFNIFVSRLETKDMLAYFRDLSLENFVADRGYGGLVKKTDGDYLMVTLTNVKGSKTDKVIDNSIKLDLQPATYNQQPAIRHNLIITRQHNGGDAEYGFYNKQNPTFVRVLVPEGAELLNISGNSNPDFKPLVDYSGGNFKRDADLFRLEATFKTEDKNFWIYYESGKKGFAFWMITDPGKEKTVELEYVVPLNLESGGYNMYIQKQPGLEVDNFEFQVNSSYIYNGGLNMDLIFKDLNI